MIPCIGARAQCSAVLHSPAIPTGEGSRATPRRSNGYDSDMFESGSLSILSALPIISDRIGTASVERIDVAQHDAPAQRPRRDRERLDPEDLHRGAQHDRSRHDLIAALGSDARQVLARTLPGICRSEGSTPEGPRSGAARDLLSPDRRGRRRVSPGIGWSSTCPRRASPRALAEELVAHPRELGAGVRAQARDGLLGGGSSARKLIVERPSRAAARPRTWYLVSALRDPERAAADVEQQDLARRPPEPAPAPRAS